MPCSDSNNDGFRQYIARQEHQLAEKLLCLACSYLSLEQLEEITGKIQYETVTLKEWYKSHKETDLQIIQNTIDNLSIPCDAMVELTKLADETREIIKSLE